MALKAAIYARYSTDLQNPQSCHDQTRECEKLVAALSGVVIGTYQDPELSGYRRDRPELERLLHDVSNGGIDLLVAESIDRIARDPEDLHRIGKKLEFHGVALHTISEGEVDHIKIAVAGLVGTIFLPVLRDKVRRGLLSVIESGRHCSRVAYGYRKIGAFDQAGHLIRGLREIHPEHAAVVQRIYRDFASGMSAIQIAKVLNAEGVKGPTGKEWSQAAIRGNSKTGAGILNNRLYCGMMIWYRTEWRRDPDSIRRERRPKYREPSEWIYKEVPELRIITDDLWNAAQSELLARSNLKLRESLAKANRKRHLLSGLIKCGVCGANFVICGKSYYRCARAVQRGACTNRSSIRLSCIENATLSVLKSSLLTSESAVQFCKEYEIEVKRLQESAGDEATQARTRLQKVKAELKNLSDNLLAGVVSTTLQDLLRSREAEKLALEAKLKPANDRCACRTPLNAEELLERFNEAIEKLAETLTATPSTENGARVLAGLIESITIYPEDDDAQHVEFSAKALSLAKYAYAEGAPEGVGASSIAVVAGAGFEPATFRL